MIKELAKKILPGKLVRYLETTSPRDSPFKGKSVQTVFTDIYERNHWKSEESHSGRGAELTRTIGIRQALPPLIKEFRLASICDIPCGDFNWMSQVDLSDVSYTGIDIVPALITSNQKKYGAAQVQFADGNLLETLLPQVDLIFNRECLVHFCFEDIRKSLVNIKHSNAQYLLTTTFKEHEVNKDIITGHWRPINLEKPPFNFPKPLLYIEEKTSHNGQPVYEGKGLGLWKIDQLPIG